MYVSCFEDHAIFMRQFEDSCVSRWGRQATGHFEAASRASIVEESDEVAVSGDRCRRDGNDMIGTKHTDMGGSKNSGTPKSSILIGFSIINHPFWDAPIIHFGMPLFLETPICIFIYIHISAYVDTPIVALGLPSFEHQDSGSKWEEGWMIVNDSQIHRSLFPLCIFFEMFSRNYIMMDSWSCAMLGSMRC